MRKPNLKLDGAVQRVLAEKDVSRRNFLRIAGGGALLAGAGTSSLLYAGQAQAKVKTNAHVVIVGAGAAGLSCATRLSRELDGAKITVIDRRRNHYYQPGLTLVATGVWNMDQTIDRNERYLPSSVNWVHAMVRDYDPDNNRVITDAGESISYDYLMVTAGLQVNHSAVEGMSPELIGTRGIGCVYDRPEYAQQTWTAIDKYTREGGRALFTRAPGAMKCAGAPLKMAMLTESRMKERGNRARGEFHYLTPGTSLFAVEATNEWLINNFAERDISLHWDHQVVAIDADARRATFQTPIGRETMDYDFIHVVPPMTAPDSLRESPLAAAEGPFRGWLEVDRFSLQHARYANVYGAGDIVGTPIGKTAASVKAQVPVAVTNMVNTIAGREQSASYDGYTSCPLITGLGKAILVEFDYNLDMVPSFDFISPYEEHWVPWVMKDRLLLAAYRAMLRGRI